MSPLDRFHSFIQEQGLFEASDHILLAVSGGRDSVLLVHFFKQCGFNFGIAHCNFMLRGAESKADELVVSELATRMEVPFFSTFLDAKSYASTHHVSIQMAARDLRYRWLEKMRAEFGFRYVALAHHQNDTVETMLLNLTRGTGIAGLHGILPKRDALIRPMLCFNRAEIDRTIAEMNISYRDDRSNWSTKYARNKIRLEVIPKLKELNPRLEETFEANRKRFAELEMILNDRIAALHDALFKEVANDEFQIDLSALKKLKPLQTLLFGLFRPFGFTEAVLFDLSKSWDGGSGKRFDSSTHRLLLDRDCLLLSEKKSECDTEVEIKQSDEHIFWENLQFSIQERPIERFELTKEATLAQLDSELLQFPLKIRVWQEGDFFHPLGMGGKKKKVSDFFVAQKIPLSHKKEIPILVNGNGDILHIVGYRMDERYKVTSQTKKVFIFNERMNTHGE